MRVVLFVLFASMATATLATEDGFSLGATAGGSDVESGSVSDTAYTLGVMARYTWSVGDNGFWGLQANWQSENGELPGIATAEILQSSDILLRFGYNTGSWSPYFVGGVSYMEAELLSSSNVHEGWKAGLGVDYHATDNVLWFIQADYAAYSKELYSLPGISFAAEGERIGLQLGFTYKF